MKKYNTQIKKQYQLFSSSIYCEFDKSHDLSGKIKDKVFCYFGLIDFILI